MPSDQINNVQVSNEDDQDQSDEIFEQNESNHKSQLQLQRRIRTRKDSGVAREYICPCGKNYLSYPALYTHVKQKHNSIPPGELQKPINYHRNNNMARNGNGSCGSEDHNGCLQPQQILTPEFEKQPFDMSLVTESINLQRTLVGEKRKLYREEVQLLIAWQISANYLQTDQKNKIIPSYFEMLLNQYNSKGAQIEPELQLKINKLQFKQDEKLYQATINQALVLFIVEVDSCLDQFQYSILILFCYILRRAVNDLKYDDQSHSEACDVQIVKDIAEIANFFVTYLIDVYINQLKFFTNSFTILNDIFKHNNLKQILTHLTCVFFNWLFKRNLSNHIIQYKHLTQIQQQN